MVVPWHSFRYFGLEYCVNTITSSSMVSLHHGMAAVWPRNASNVQVLWLYLM